MFGRSSSSPSSPRPLPRGERRGATAVRATTPVDDVPTTAATGTSTGASTASTRTGTSAGTTTGAGKGRPTPKRKVAQAANRRPLVPLDRKAAAREERARRRVQRDQEYRAMQSGDERFLPVRDRGPVRRFVRDHVDARRSLGELFLPVAFVLLIAQTLFVSAAPTVTAALTVVLYVFILGTVVDAFLLWRALKKKLVAKFGEAALPRGLALYAITRIFQLRRLRMPKPQVKRGQYPA